ncbi:MAG: SH3 domain-containing protein [Candidatus Cyclobacteriaceae bacterium M3_2C_046]
MSTLLNNLTIQLNTKRFLFLILLFCTSISFNTQAQAPERMLQRADSLFMQNKYTESFEIYQTLFEDYQAVSPSMLSKMAYIKEGLGEYSRALYYLNLYYLKTSNKLALRKMEELAHEHDLRGYEYTDWDFFLNLYQRYFTEILYFFLALALLIFSLIYFRKNRIDQKPIGLGVFYFLVLAAVFYLINWGGSYDKGIIIQSRTYIMNAPSSGSDLIEIVEKGHRVNILGEQDVWTKIKWEGKPAYIRNSHILKING